jgi:hypothetical protein
MPIARPSLLAACVTVAVLIACRPLPHGAGVAAPAGPTAAQEPPRLTTTDRAASLQQWTSAPDTDEVWPAMASDGAGLAFEGMVRGESYVVYAGTGDAATWTWITGAGAGTPSWHRGSLLYRSTADRYGGLLQSTSLQAGAAARVLVPPSVVPDAWAPVVSPDGQWIAFYANSSGRSEVALARVDGSGVVLLRPGREPSWHPNGRWLLVVVDEPDGTQQLYSLDVSNAAAPIAMTQPAPGARYRRPSWSPDGNHFVVEAHWPNAQEATYAHGNLYLGSTNGGPLITLTEGNTPSGQPFWAADGWIYFTSRVAGSLDIWRLAVPAQPAPGTGGGVYPGTGTGGGTIHPAPPQQPPAPAAEYRHRVTLTCNNQVLVDQLFTDRASCEQFASTHAYACNGLRLDVICP